MPARTPMRVACRRTGPNREARGRASTGRARSSQSHFRWYERVTCSLPPPNSISIERRRATGRRAHRRGLRREDRPHVTPRLAVVPGHMASRTSLDEADVRAHAVAGEARRAIGDADRAAAHAQRWLLLREPAVDGLEEQPDVDERVDVLVRVRLVEREDVVLRVGLEGGGPGGAVGRLLRGGRRGCGVARLGELVVAVDREPRDLALIGRRHQARERVLGEDGSGGRERAWRDGTRQRARGAFGCGPHVHVDAADVVALLVVRKAEAGRRRERTVDADRVIEARQRQAREDRDHALRERVARARMMDEHLAPEAAERGRDRKRDQPAVLRAVLVAEVAGRRRGLALREVWNGRSGKHRGAAYYGARDASADRRRAAADRGRRARPRSLRAGCTARRRQDDARAGRAARRRAGRDRRAAAAASGGPARGGADRDGARRRARRRGRLCRAVRQARQRRDADRAGDRGRADTAPARRPGAARRRLRRDRRVSRAPPRRRPRARDGRAAARAPARIEARRDVGDPGCRAGRGPPGRPGPRRKVILATNVAETSATIEGVTRVVDSGLARIARHSPWSGVPSLEIEPVSKASCTQRAGRAGRTRPGRVLRLYTKHDFYTRRPFELPEIARADLAGVALELHGAGVHDLRWYEPPPAAAWQAGEDLLVRIGAVKAGAITALGRRMLQFPVHPRQARIVVEAEGRGVAREACILAALLGARELRLERRGRGEAKLSSPSDLIDDLDALLDARSHGLRADRLRRDGLDIGTAHAVARAAKQLERLAATRARAPASDLA